MRSFRTITAFVMALLLSAGAFAQSRGPLRLTGKVVDAAGQPVEGADVRAAKKGEPKPLVFSAKTNKKGEWTITGLASGQWVIEAMKEGVGGMEITETINEGEGSRPLAITLAKAAPPTVDPSAEINAEHARAIELAQGGKVGEARAIYDALLVKHPTVYQLHAMLGAMYAAENNAVKALEHINIALAKEPANVDWQVLSAELMMESGDKSQKDAAQKILDSVDLAKVKDPRAFVNSAINKINSGDKAQAEQATELLTRLIAKFPAEPMYLYLRARSFLVTTKLPEAKADLEKYVATAPATAAQLADAKKLLDQLNKK